MPNIPNVPIDWASVNWLYVAVLAVFVFFSALIGRLLFFKHAVFGAILSALLFVAAFVFWTYYPHGLPLPTSPAAQKTTAAPVPTAPAAPSPRNSPVTTINPPPSPQSPPSPPATGQ